MKLYEFGVEGGVRFDFVERSLNRVACLTCGRRVRENEYGTMTTQATLGTWLLESGGMNALEDVHEVVGRDYVVRGRVLALIEKHGFTGYVAHEVKSEAWASGEYFLIEPQGQIDIDLSVYNRPVCPDCKVFINIPPRNADVRYDGGELEWRSLHEEWQSTHGVHICN